MPAAGVDAPLTRRQSDIGVYQAQPTRSQDTALLQHPHQTMGRYFDEPLDEGTF